MEFSRLALKRGSNASTKNFARQILADNRKIKEQLNLSTSSNGSMPADVAPDGSRSTDRARAATEKLELLAGPQFDRQYLAPMGTYVREDQQTGHSAYAMMDLPHLSQLGLQVWTLANDRSKQIAKLAGMRTSGIRQA